MQTCTGFASWAIKPPIPAYPNCELGDKVAHSYLPHFDCHSPPADVKFCGNEVADPYGQPGNTQIQRMPIFATGKRDDITGIFIINQKASYIKDTN